MLGTVIDTKCIPSFNVYTVSRRLNISTPILQTDEGSVIKVLVQACETSRSVIWMWALGCLILRDFFLFQ